MSMLINVDLSSIIIINISTISRRNKGSIRINQSTSYVITTKEHWLHRGALRTRGLRTTQSTICQAPVGWSKYTTVKDKIWASLWYLSSSLCCIYTNKKNEMKSTKITEILSKAQQILCCFSIKVKLSNDEELNFSLDDVFSWCALPQ